MGWCRRRAGYAKLSQVGGSNTVRISGWGPLSSANFFFFFLHTYFGYHPTFTPRHRGLAKRVRPRTEFLGRELEVKCDR
ncbi:hypothetical protein PspLS_00684 [Pyricularia sp. CBS 133598]|nr:hypothetical protein PspLS_00684 [Pyricularia sp. CBS 133598]